MSMMNGPVTTIDLLRHGQCEGGEIYRGSTDVPLTDLGWSQMKASLGAETELAGRAPWNAIVSSPLQRCRLFAEAQSEQLKVSAEINEAFREMHFGDWEGRELKEVWQADREKVTQFYADPGEQSPPNGESMNAVKARLLPAWDELVEAQRGKHVLLVQHGGTIRILLSHLLKMPISAVTRLDIPYASLSRIQVFDAQGAVFPRLVFLNRAIADGTLV